MRIAACQYPITKLDSWEAYATKLEQLTHQAVNHDVDLLLFPEHALLELVTLFEPNISVNALRMLEQFQMLLPDYLGLHVKLAQQHDVYIVAGAYPVRETDGSFYYRAYFIDPEGSIQHQDKLMMTMDENLPLRGGEWITLFDTKHGRFGITVGDDLAFPSQARQLTERGATMILAPGHASAEVMTRRLGVAASARAMEHQCYVVQTYTCGGADIQGGHMSLGRAAVRTPIGRGFPNDGLAAQSEEIAPPQGDWLIADLEIARIETIRQDGQGLCHQHWNQQRKLPLHVQKME